jgi:hypothetical protein
VIDRARAQVAGGGHVVAVHDDAGVAGVDVPADRAGDAVVGVPGPDRIEVHAD